jgi:hypothetical protein
LRGKFVHNAVVAQPIAAFCRARGSRVTEEVQLPGNVGAVDLLVELPDGRRWVVEVETAPKRVRWAVMKAAQLATVVFIVVPTRTLATRCQRVLRRPPRLDRLPQLRVLVVPYGGVFSALEEALLFLPITLV